MTYFIETYQNGKPLLGSDFTTIVKNCRGDIKLKNAIIRHNNRLISLSNIKPFLLNKYSLKIVKS